MTFHQHYDNLILNKTSEISHLFLIDLSKSALDLNHTHTDTHTLAHKYTKALQKCTEAVLDFVLSKLIAENKYLTWALFIHFFQFLLTDLSTDLHLFKFR